MTEAIIHGQRTDSPEQPLRKQRVVITIDGPAGSGKSTVAKLLALRLGYLYLDTGTLYRAVAWKVRQAGIDPSDGRAIAALISTTTITVQPDAEHIHVRLDGQGMTEELRTPEISRIASLVAAIPAVRERLLPVQQRMGAAGGVVAEGRDLGTQVFPRAQVKFFLEAAQDVRAARRHREFMASGHRIPLAQTRQELETRDARDRSRDMAPLVPASDATVIDTSALGVDEVVTRMLDVIATKL